MKLQHGSALAVLAGHVGLVALAWLALPAGGPVSMAHLARPSTLTVRLHPAAPEQPTSHSTATVAPTVRHQRLATAAATATETAATTTTTTTTTTTSPAPATTEKAPATPEPTVGSPPTAAPAVSALPTASSVAATLLPAAAANSSTEPSTALREPEPLLQIARADHAFNPPPDYPSALLERGVGGVVWLRVRVERDGRAADVQLLRGSGQRLLDEAALAAARGWRFVAARRGAQSLASWVEFPVRFAVREPDQRAAL